MLSEKRRPSGCFLWNVRREQITASSRAGVGPGTRGWGLPRQGGIWLTYLYMSTLWLSASTHHPRLPLLSMGEMGVFWAWVNWPIFAFCLRVRWIALDFPLPFCCCKGTISSDELDAASGSDESPSQVSYWALAADAPSPSLGKRKVISVSFTHTARKHAGIPELW